MSTLLVFQSQEIEPDEQEWFKSQIKEASEAEDVEELIESMNPMDAL
jgi:hypothetical protein